MSDHLITLLRTATGHIHKDLEAMPVSKSIMSPEITVDGYIAYLHKVYTIHAAIETNVFSVAAAYVSDIENRKKTPLLIHDLNVLQAEVKTTGIFLDERFISSPAFCMGMLYVSEGSTLGGQYILKNIQKALGENAAEATTFLNAYGPRTGSMWKAFTEMLSKYENTLTEEQMQEVASGAVYGFERTGVLFSQL